jgi:polysaccharide biosynthesis protein PslH
MTANGRGGTMILTAGSLTHKGGMALRLGTLAQALAARGPCAVRELRCNRWRQCWYACQANGRTSLGERGLTYDSDGLWYFEAAFCRARADDIAARCDRAGLTTIVCSGFDTHRYVREFAARGGFRVVLDMHNVELPLHRAIHEAAPPGSHFALQYTEEHLALLAAAEGTAVATADEVWLCSDTDRRLAITTYPGTPPERLRVVPNVVEVGATPPRFGEYARVCFTGRLDYYPNVQAGDVVVDEIAPRLAALGHDLPVVVAGGGVARAFGDRPVGPNVRLISDPATTDDIIAGSIMVVPLWIGGGSRFKILEAFARGAPVISTPKGVEGLDVTSGVHYLEAVQPADFATAVDALVRDPALGVRLGRAGWELVRERYSVAALSQALAGDRAVPAAAPAR